MERGLKKAHKTYILARRQIVYRMMYKTSRKNFARILLCVHLIFTCLSQFSFLSFIQKLNIIDILEVYQNYRENKKTCLDSNNIIFILLFCRFLYHYSFLSHCIHLHSKPINTILSFFYRYNYTVN
jgi:hypothetical protein